MTLMRPRVIRLLTALAVVGMCIWPVWKGFDVTRFALAGSKAEAVLPWLDDAGVAFAAREDALTSIMTRATMRPFASDAMKLPRCSIKPLSSFYWIQLAEARVDAHEPIAKALEAFQLSEVTGPNEEYMITQRGMFGIWQWETLPPDVQQRSIADLVSGYLSDTKLAWLKKTLAEKPEPVRQQIRSDLQTQGLPQTTLARMGL